MLLQRSVRVHTFHRHLLYGYFERFKRLFVVIAKKSLAHFTNQLLVVVDKVKQDLLNAGTGSKSKFGLMPPKLEIGLLPSKENS